MDTWRIKLRNGSRGADMWPQCKLRNIGAIMYFPILDTDLTELTPEEVDPAVKTSARASIRRFAWKIKGGDVIYVGDSDTKKLIARGEVACPIGERAYRYNSKDAIYPEIKSDEPWRHEIPVIWNTIEPIKYRDGAPRYTVSPIETAWPDGGALLLQSEHSDKPVALAPLLNDAGYLREIEASRKHVQKLHASLSNCFRKWVQKKWQIDAVQEEHYVDTKFSLFGKTTMVEFKICYGSQTRRAIREALGQIMEYNHYPKRTEAGSWWLILDHAPSRDDHSYIATLRGKYGFPLVLGWPAKDGFELSQEPG